MKVVCIKDYNDKELARSVYVDEVLNVSEDRANTLVRFNVCQIASEDVIEETPKRTRKKKSDQ